MESRFKLSILFAAVSYHGFTLIFRRLLDVGMQLNLRDIDYELELINRIDMSAAYGFVFALALAGHLESLIKLPYKVLVVFVPLVAGICSAWNLLLEHVMEYFPEQLDLIYAESALAPIFLIIVLWGIMYQLCRTLIGHLVRAY